MASFIIIIIIYILAVVGGIATYKLLPFDWWLNLLLADIAATIITFIFSLMLKNSSVYDAYWSVQPIVILICYSIGKTLGLLQILLLVAVCFWGIRLTANWAYTFTDFTYHLCFVFSISVLLLEISSCIPLKVSSISSVNLYHL